MVATKHQEALQLVEQYLIGLGATPLNDVALGGLYPRRGFVGGWRLEVRVANQEITVNVLVGEGFPRTLPRVALAKPPDFPSWPHVERDGFLCLGGGDETFDETEPVEVLKSVLRDAAELLERGISGVNDEDFRSEFCSYWASPRVECPTALSLIKVEGPTRRVSAWTESAPIVVAETDAELRAWLRNYSPSKRLDRELGGAILMWVDRMPLPPEYPRTAEDVLRLARRNSGDAERLLRELCGNHQSVLVVLGGPTQHGPGLGGILIRPPVRSAPGRKRSSEEDLERGFRPGRIPSGLVAERMLGATRISRVPVERADASWVHGRGLDRRAARLRDLSVAVLGCGSLGSQAARLLCQAGVGKLLLVDPQELAWSNIGRHALGARAVFHNKAKLLRDRLLEDFPHVREITAEGRPWVEVAPTIKKADVILSAMGSWEAETLLNEWQLREGRKPTIVYAWAEPHAAAGHALAISRAGSCFRCGFEANGSPRQVLTKWPQGATMHHEPACGAVFQPYGPIEFCYIVALAAEMILDALLAPSAETRHRVWLAPEERLTLTGGVLSDLGRQIAAGRSDGAFQSIAPWPNSTACPDCSA